MNETALILLVTAAVLFAIIIIVKARKKNKQDTSAPIIKTLQEIQDNPFRHLGVFANASLKEQTAQATQEKAYARVGQELDNPLRLLHLLGPLPDDEETFKANESLLSLPQKREKYAAFWFVHGPNRDEDLRVVKLLDQGEKLEAIKAWEDRNEPEAMQNLMVAHLVLGHWKHALQTAQRFYRHEFEIRRFVKAVTDGFNVPMKQFANAVADDHLWSPVLKDMLVENYRYIVNEAIDNNDYSLLSAVDTLIELRNIIGADDVLYQTLADRLSNALARQYPFGGTNMYVMKCLNKAYEIAVDESLKKTIIQRIVIMLRNDGSLGKYTDILIDNPAVRKAQKDEARLSILAIIVVVFVSISAGRACHRESKKPKYSLPPNYQMYELPKSTITTYSLPNMPAITTPPKPTTITPPKAANAMENIENQ